MGIKIITDSTADLPVDLARHFSIQIVPLYVNFGDQAYRDGIDITQENFLKKVEELPVFPHTSQPTPHDFSEVFRPLLEQGHEVIYIGISSKLSGSISSASLARQQLGDTHIAIIDSCSISTGIGLLAIHAAKLAAAGLPLPKIVSEVEKMIPRIKIAFLVDNLDYLCKGGRLSAAHAIIGNILRIHPMIEVKEGKLVLAEKIRGQKTKADDRLIEWMMSNRQNIDPAQIWVLHSYAPKDADYVKNVLLKEKIAEEIIVNHAGCVVSTHCGPGTVGLLYVEKE